jgi:hypothetical protein
MAMAIAMGRAIVYVLFRGSMSWMVVGESVENVWTALVHEFGPWNKTCMIWFEIWDGINKIYSGH